MEMVSHQKIRKKIAFEHFVLCPVHFLVSFQLRTGNVIFHYIKYLNYKSLSWLRRSPLVTRLYILLLVTMLLYILVVTKLLLAAAWAPTPYIIQFRW
jgi:hypothetical protein